MKFIVIIFASAAIIFLVLAGILPGVPVWSATIATNYVPAFAHASGRGSLPTHGDGPPDGLLHRDFRPPNAHTA